jgi:DNA-binding CsgD family transcriptional regulator
MDAAIEGAIIVRLYAAATGEGSWTCALEAMGAGLGARTLVLISHPAGSGDASILGAVGIGAEALSAYHRGLTRQSPPIDGDFATTTSETICGPRLLRCSVDVDMNGDVAQTAHLVALRPHDAAEFGIEEREDVSRLVPHLRQALRTALRLDCATGLHAALQTLGDRLGKGVALLDSACHVLFANEVLERICADADGLTTRHGVLTPSRPNEAAFARMVANALRGDMGGRLDVTRPSGCPPYSLLMRPVRPAVTGLVGSPPRIVAVVMDPARSCGSNDLSVARTYGLTRAESRMVAHLVGGATVSATADHLGITLNTARTHLKRAMAKTGVSRQADLVRLLLTRH